MANVELTQESFGTLYELGLGDELVLRLPENPTTGFRWSFAASGDGAVEPRGDTFDASGFALPGAAGQRIFRFAATRPGSVLLTLTHGRAWELGTGQSQLLTLLVR